MDRRLNTKLINKLLVSQVLVLAVLVALFYGVHGTENALAAIFGGSIAIGNSLLQKWHLVRAAKAAKSDPRKDLNKVYRCMIERWCWTLIMFALGFGLLKLTAFTLLASFVITQAVLFFLHKN
ncbi:F0F1 ATP synthase subunit I [Marinomonas spartinae]|uniref:F0F1 ATP synthase subunit I n=1 Tax=Marinomonas spartinae TaxID=1792290 RepID=A0A1A8T301_9GAMM|nr:ATP synthase subunit I [Marinomonas spartinae]SBS25089.1 F0F1 ATP synthase subunit I [Marinomonas spartinae]